MSRPGPPAVLLVDDEAHVLSALRRCLRREGYEILTAESGPEALRILEERSVQAIVSDHRMSGMSGLALLRRAAALQPGAALLLLSGWPEAVSSEELDKLGVLALLEKPWDDAELKARLRSALSGA